MEDIVLIDGQQHRQVRVLDRVELTPQEGLGRIGLFPSELDAAHKEFPVFFCKDAQDGQFHLTLILSLQKDGNCFFADGAWQTRYQPLLCRRGPFLMTNSEPPQLCINLADSRVSPDGESLFTGQGELSAYGLGISQIMAQIHQGRSDNRALAKSLLDASLLEPLSVNLPQASDNLNGLYSVNPEKLRALSGQALADMNARGHLQWAFFLASSASNILRLRG